MQGTVIIENNKFTEEFFAKPNEVSEKKEDKEKTEMEKTIEEEKTDEKEKTWKVKFYNKGMFMNSKLMEIRI